MPRGSGLGEGVAPDDSNHYPGLWRGRNLEQDREPGGSPGAERRTHAEGLLGGLGVLKKAEAVRIPPARLMVRVDSGGTG